jgi:IS5 family transposase
MHQTKKGNQWYFGMKAHFDVDSRTKLIHSARATPANVADSTVLPQLLHGNETRVRGDQAYRGQRAVIRRKAPRARDFVTAAVATAPTSMKPSARRTAGNRRCGPRACPREGGGRAPDQGHQAGLRLY